MKLGDVTKVVQTTSGGVSTAEERGLVTIPSLSLLLGGRTLATSSPWPPSQIASPPYCLRLLK